jgi:hypothetical protein
MSSDLRCEKLFPLRVKSRIDGGNVDEELNVTTNHFAVDFLLVKTKCRFDEKLFDLSQDVFDVRSALKGVHIIDEANLEERAKKSSSMM